MELPRFGNGPAWESDPHFRISTHPNRILISTSDPGGFVDYVNPPWSTLTGIHAVSLLGIGWHAAIHPLDLPALQAAMAAATASHAAFRERFRLRRHDGSHLWMVMDAHPRVNERSTHVGYAISCLDVTPHSESELELDLAEERLTDLIRESQLPGIALDVESNIIFVNEAFCRLSGRPSQELVYRKLGDALGLGDRSTAIARLYPEGRQSQDYPMSFETDVVRADQGRRTVRWHALVMRQFSGQAKGAVLLGQDVTHEIEAEAKLLLTHRVFETTDQAMVITDARGTILSVNKAFTRLTGYARDEAIGQNPKILQSGRHDRAFYEAMWSSIRTSGHWHGDIWDRRKDGSTYPKYLSISAIRDERGEITNYSGIFYDITERKTLEEQLDRLAHIDALTGLANRVLLYDRCEVALSLARRTGNRVALLYIDLDRFKTINDTLGHQTGDAVLKEVAERLRACIRRHDTAARLGGDEFVLLLPEITGVDDAAHVGRKVLGALSAPLVVDASHCMITPSIGISIYPDDASNLTELFGLADRAMYKAKESGRARMVLNGELPPPSP
jgi:diguanylate cyclase (GGDEF)-like protein/PAS domain S-box-containing protein